MDEPEDLTLMCNGSNYSLPNDERFKMVIYFYSPEFLLLFFFTKALSVCSTRATRCRIGGDSGRWKNESKSGERRIARVEESERRTRGIGMCFFFS